MADDDKTDDKKPDEFAVKFKTEGEFLAAVEKRAKSKISKAADDARAELLGKLGVESVDDIEGLLGKVKSSEGATTELDKLKSTLDKTLKKLGDADKVIGELRGFKTSSLKAKALAAHAAKVRDAEALEAFVSSQLSVGDDGTVTGPDGKDVGKLVDELLEAKPYLKSPDFKEGAGTKPTTKKVDAGYFKPASDKEPLSIGKAMINELIANGKLPAPTGAGGP